jgi:hypothetical protein
MPGYQLDGYDNTNPIGLDTSNALDKQPTSSDFLGTVRVIDLPLDQSAVIYPGGIYVPDRVVPAYVQGNSFAGGGTPVGSETLAYPSNVGAGNLLVVAVGWAQSGGPSGCTITDTQGNSFSAYPSGGPFLLSNISYLIQIFYAVAGSAAADSIIFSSSPTAPFFRMLIHEYSGATTTVDASVSNLINGPTNPMTSTVTTTVANDLLFAWTVDNAGVTGYTSPATLRQTAGSESTGDKPCPTAGSNSISATVGQQGGGQLAIAFQAGTGGPGTVNGTGTGAILFGGTGTATVTVNDTGTGAITFNGAGTATSFGPVSGTGGISFAGSGTAQLTINDSGTGAITFGGAGTAHVISVGTGSGAIVFGGSATASLAISATGAGAIVFSGAGIASFSGNVSASGTGAIVFGGSATAVVTLSSSGSGAILFAGSGVAHIVAVGVGTGAITFAGTGTARVTLSASGSGDLSFAGSGIATETGGTGVPIPPLHATVALRPLPQLTVAKPSSGLVAVSQRLPASVSVALRPVAVVVTPLE